jgi:hypothetical protein
VAFNTSCSTLFGEYFITFSILDLITGKIDIQGEQNNEISAIHSKTIYGIVVERWVSLVD